LASAKRSAGRGCLANAAFVAELRYNSLKSSELLGQWPLIATNGICLVLAAFILVMKILPASGKRAVADTLDPSADGS
jgi:hypothetical protein